MLKNHNRINNATVSRTLRRGHLYLGLLLMPWFLMYAFSALPFSHRDFFSARFDPGGDPWIPRFDTVSSEPVPDLEDKVGMREWAARVLDEHRMSGSFGTYSTGDGKINIFVSTFWSASRITYDPVSRRLIGEDRRFRWDQFFTRMHAKGGYQQENWLVDFWAIFVDLVALSMMAWVATGIYLWWKLRPSRQLGLWSLGGGVTVFVIFIACL